MSIADPTLAEITMFAGNFNPRFWANCDGQLIAISTNAALFSLVGTIYGGDGRTTFALPDLRGRFPMHTGTGPGLSPRPQGQRAGTETTTLNITNLPSHGHALSAKAEGNTDDPTGAFVAGDGTNSFGTTSDLSMNASAVSATGGNQPFDNMPPYLVVRFIIALQGIFPSRS